jgi:tetratricopeptide (TPR) repeat protein/TolB-like protein
MIGDQISHYKIIEKLGTGGMGEVYRAEDLKLKRSVALKFLPEQLTSDTEAKERFIQEARASSSLDHPNICTIFEIDETEEGRLFICMAYCSGEALKQKLAAGPLSVEDATDIALQAAGGLSKAHGQGIVHRDIKPANMMVTDDGQVKIVDFGLAKLAGAARITRMESTMGTAAYMSPEQARGDEVDHRTDIWSLGVALYEMLAGKPPFKGEYEQAVIYSVLNDDPESLKDMRPDMPEELEWILRKAMQKDPGDRYADMDEMAADLKRFRQESGVSGEIIPPPAGAKRQGRRRSHKIAVTAGALAILIAAVLMVKIFFFGEAEIVDPKRIAVINFVNQTGDTNFDYLRDAIPNLLITSLEQSKYLRVITWERMRDILKQMGKGDVEIIDRDLGFELCRREGIEAIVLGTFTKAGNIFATDVKVLDVATKQPLKSVSARGEGVSSILENQIDTLSKEISRGVGLPDRKIGTAADKIASVTTTSMEAYNHFLTGRENLERMYFDDARRSFEEAVRLDPEFAVAHLQLALVHGLLGNTGEMEEAYEKALRFAERATEKERLLIEAAYAGAIEKDEDKRFRILTDMAEKYPGEKAAHIGLAAYHFQKEEFDRAIEASERTLALDPDYGPALNLMAYMIADRGDHEKALELIERYAAVSPGDANPLDSMAELYFRIGRLDDAIEKYREALMVKPTFGSGTRIAYIYAMKEDYEKSMEWVHQFIAMASSTGPKVEGYLWKAFYYAWMGNLDFALRSIEKAETLADAAGNDRLKATSDWLRGWIYLDLGEISEGRRCFESWFRFSTNNNPALAAYYTAIYEFYMGLGDIEEGRPAAARERSEKIKTLLEEMESAFIKRVTFAEAYLRGEILLAEGRAEEAAGLFRNLPPPGIPSLESLQFIGHNVPFVQDVVARAYRDMGETGQAVRVYRRLMTFDPRSERRKLIHPLYHYRLARLLEEAGRPGEAAGAYETFLHHWRNADAQRPEPADAKSRLARLTGGKAR